MNGEMITAIHAAVYLYHKNDWCNSEEIARNVCTNPVCVRRVLAKLVKAGLIEKKEGAKQGGYRCDRSERVTLGQIAQALGVRVVEAKYRSGDTDQPCLIASGMQDYIAGLCDCLDRGCKDRLDCITVEEVERALIRPSR